jgi:hypothetical protein
MKEEAGMPLKNDKGEIVKCERCDGIYRWDGSLLLSYPAQLPFYCNKCNHNIIVSEHILFPERYPEFQEKLS